MESKSKKSENKLNVGKDAVVIGNIIGNVGDGSVVIGATDANGNTIINTSMAVGRGACAGTGSIAIGAGACAGSEISMILNEINKIISISNDMELIKTFAIFREALDNPKQNKTLLLKLWEGIKIASTLNGVISLVSKVSTWISGL